MVPSAMDLLGHDYFVGHDVLLQMLDLPLDQDKKIENHNP